MLFALFDIGVARIGIDRVFLAMQQFGHLCDIGDIRRRAVNAANQPRLNVSTDRRLHPKNMGSLSSFGAYPDRICRLRFWSS